MCVSKRFFVSCEQSLQRSDGPQGSSASLKEVRRLVAKQAVQHCSLSAQVVQHNMPEHLRRAKHSPDLPVAVRVDVSLRPVAKVHLVAADGCFLSFRFPRASSRAPPIPREDGAVVAFDECRVHKRRHFFRQVPPHALCWVAQDLPLYIYRDRIGYRLFSTDESEDTTRRLSSGANGKKRQLT